MTEALSESFPNWNVRDYDWNWEQTTSVECCIHPSLRNELHRIPHVDYNRVGDICDVLPALASIHL
jgi:hypothetical protein